MRRGKPAERGKSGPFGAGDGSQRITSSFLAGALILIVQKRTPSPPPHSMASAEITTYKPTYEDLFSFRCGDRSENSFRGGDDPVLNLVYIRPQLGGPDGQSIGIFGE
jgi:hypothetical protein